MAANKENVIVVKKITINGGGHHGGSWKVALADFMTALMAFFLLMWLLAQTPEVKKDVSDYFSTPSVVEYNFSNFGAELTLEKLFLDLVNEPLKTLQDFMQPVDYTPNYLNMGSKNIVMATLSEEIGDFATGFNVTGDEIVIEIPESALFRDGSAEPLGAFATHMDKLAKFTAGLQDADVRVTSVVYLNAVGNSRTRGNNVAERRLDLVLGQIDRKLEHQSVDLQSKTEVRAPERRPDGRPKEGYIRVVAKQKEMRSDGTKPRKMTRILGRGDSDTDVYNNFVKKMSKAKTEDEVDEDAKEADEIARGREAKGPQRPIEVDESGRPVTGSGARVRAPASEEPTEEDLGPDVE